MRVRFSKPALPSGAEGAIAAIAGFTNPDDGELALDTVFIFELNRVADLSRHWLGHAPNANAIRSQVGAGHLRSELCCRRTANFVLDRQRNQHANNKPGG